MKKIACVLTSLAFSVLITQSANANMEVVMGPGGPEVVVNMGVPGSMGPTAVQGMSVEPRQGIGGSYARVDDQGNVGNIEVCHSYCANGTFGSSGDLSALQIANSNTGIWFGPGTTTYDRETRTFRATDPKPIEIELQDGDSSVKISGNRVLTFVSGNVFIDSSGEFSGVTQSWTEGSSANVSVTSNGIEESLNLGNRKTNQQVRTLIQDSNLLLLNDRVQVLITLLGSWVK